MLDGDDAPTFGPADLMVIKRTRGASGHSPVVIGMVWAERMKCEWLKLKFTTSLKQRVPAPCSITKKPFTINTVRAGQQSLLPVWELSWKQCPSVSMCQKPVPHAWGTAVTFHMTIIICSLLFVAISGKLSHLGINQVERLSVCALLDVNKNTSLNQRVIKRWWKKLKSLFHTVISLKMWKHRNCQADRLVVVFNLYWWDAAV